MKSADEIERGIEMYGYCDPNTRRIGVELGLGDFNTLYLWTHEAYHAVNPEEKEKKVIRASDFIARAIWHGAGYRHPHITEE